MTPGPGPSSPETGVTDAAAGPDAKAGPVRFLPPTAQEVGRAAALCFQDTHSDEQIARQLATAALQAWQELMGEEEVSPETAPVQRRR
jgi:hypothetical protein